MTNLQTSTLTAASPATQRPGYDRSSVSIGMVHFGVGGFHRAHQAVYLDDLLALDPAAHQFGLCGVNLLPTDRRIVEVLTKQDTLYTVLVGHGDSDVSARVVGSILDHRYAPDQPEAVLDLLCRPTIKIVTLTITEGGYYFSPGTGEVDTRAPDLLHDVAHPEQPRTAFGYILEALRRRRAAGVAPFTVLSCDNVHGNGDVTRQVVTSVAERTDPELGRWVADTVAFPNSMVDRITPRTTAENVVLAEQLTGLHDEWPVLTEPFTQWVVEDRFPAGRPAWERVGAELVDDVRPYELMKMRLLNAGHQTIAYAGELLGHAFGHEACADPTVRELLSRFQQEAMQTLAAIPGTDFPAYAHTVTERFASPQIRDSIGRLTDQSSTMLPNYVLPVIRDLLGAGRDATISIAVVACWARFCQGVRDDGTTYTVSDRQAADLTQRAGRQESGDPLAMIRDNPLFADLEGRADFTHPYLRTMRALQEGVRVGLSQVLNHAAPGS